MVARVAWYTLGDVQEWGIGSYLCWGVGVTPSGVHLLADLWGVDAGALNEPAALEATMVEAVRRGGATVIDSRFAQFEPHGVSGVVLLAESHASIHTWPEHGYAAVDVYTCGPETIARAVLAEIEGALAPEHHEVHRVDRGIAPPVPRAVAGG